MIYIDTTRTALSDEASLQRSQHRGLNAMNKDGLAKFLGFATLDAFIDARLQERAS